MRSLMIRHFCSWFDDNSPQLSIFQSFLVEGVEWERHVNLNAFLYMFLLSQS